LLDEYRDGVTFVALAPVRDPTHVPAAIAQALGLREVAELPLIEQLKHALKPRRRSSCSTTSSKCWLLPRSSVICLRLPLGQGAGGRRSIAGLGLAGEHLSRGGRTEDQQ